MKHSCANSVFLSAAENTIAWLQQHMTDCMITIKVAAVREPSSSPYLSSLIFFLWGQSQSLIYQENIGDAEQPKKNYLLRNPQDHHSDVHRSSE